MQVIARYLDATCGVVDIDFWGVHGVVWGTENDLSEVEVGEMAPPVRCSENEGYVLYCPVMYLLTTVQSHVQVQDFEFGVTPGQHVPTRGKV